MPSTTTNLGLYKKNPSTDGNDTFDINTMLNDNWDKVDAQLGAQFADAAPTPVNLVNGLQVVDVPQTAPLENLRITGRTLVNLLGRDGNCEDVGRWVQYFGATLSLDGANQKYGNNAIKFTCTSASNPTGFYREITNLIVPGRYYLAVADVKNGNAVNGVAIQINLNNNTSASTYNITSTYQPKAIRFQAPASGLSYVYAIANTGTAVGQFGYADGFRLYEVTQAEYNALATITDAQVAAKYPYVDDVKHVNAPYVIKYGENLTATFNEWIVYAGSPQILEPYKVNVSLNDKLVYGHKVVLGQAYSISVIFSDANGRINVSFSDAAGATIGSAIDAVGTGLQKVENLIAPTNAVSLDVRLLGTNTAMTTASNPVVSLGGTVKPFKPRNDDQLLFPNVQLASSVDGKVYDTLFKREGKYFVEKRFKDVLLDGSLAWLANDFSGVKQVRVPQSLLGGDGLAGSGVVIKQDGRIIPQGVSSVADFNAVSADGNFYLGIADTDSGWGETYTPTTQEIQAYFYGWIMYDGTNSTPYTTGTKYWRKSTVSLGNATVTDGSAVMTNVPNYSVGAGYMPYKLTYQLATPTFEEVQVDAGMTLHEGLNQIEVGQGVIVREKAFPSYSVGAYRISDVAFSSSNLRYRNSMIMGIFKSNILDKKWIIDQNSSYGNYRMYIINSSDFDPAATYEVTYIALDQHSLSAPVNTVNGDVASNIKKVVDVLCMNQSDIEVRTSETERLVKQFYNVPQKTTTDMTVYVDATNGADNNDGSKGKPFKTINKAISIVPQIVNHTVRVNVATGTYAETAVLYGFNGSGVVQLVASGVVSLNAISVIRCQTTVVEGFTCTSTTGNGFYTEYGRMTIFNNCKTISASSFAGFSVVSQNGQILNCTISNKDNAVAAQYGSSVLVSNCTGTSNNYVLVAADGATLTYSGSVPSGNILFGTYNVGMINKGFVVNPWGDNTFGTRPASRAMGSVSSGQAISASVWTKVQFPVENFDNLGSYDNATLYRFTAPSTGIYHIDTNVLLTAIAANTTLQLSIYLNGTHYRRLDYFLNVNSASAYELKGNASIYLGVGDYIEIYLNSSTAITLAYANDINFEVIRIA
ncbi:right-handed parallel beta-helix repeat-containing protein [Paenibacillus sp. MAH-36]|uniref:Right-handed parallel beta-helix repeat-containing protein n=1 Tax=Paenibacillus violae TaxID=3077234 RepID=A0ABU3RHS4_9BACL|nr:right-handed parallel beta-helix repeat-containing protein [Paenibacillus sp. PFR10]MDU0203831.1 right-handed parallel beta-helix repeat-containing protein [Paenibacillus sp. PFR10]